jgi:Fe(3+) dicitrate transport protein
MNLSVFSNYSFVDARYTRWDNPTLAIEGKRVENAPTHILRTGLTMRLKGFAATLQYNYVSEVFTDALNTESPNSTATTGQLPAYSLIDLNVSYQLKEKYQFRAGINNLTDAAYATRRAGGYPGPGILPGTGRTFYLSIGFRL